MDSRLYAIMITLEVNGAYPGYISDKDIQAIYDDWAKYGITTKIERVGFGVEVRNS